MILTIVNGLAALTMIELASAVSTCSNSCVGEGSIFQGVHPPDTTIIANLPPPLRPGETTEMRHQVDHILDYHWRNSTAYYSRAAEDAKELTYGELTTLGVRQLVHFMGLAWNAETPTVFVDVGSGAGKMVVQMYLEQTVDRAVGIEKCPTRHGFAIEGWRRVQEANVTLESRAPIQRRSVDVELYNEDARYADYSAATHVFMASLCFPEDLTISILDKLVRSAKSLRVVASLSDLSLLEQPSWIKTIHELQTSWGRSRLRVYQKSVD